MSTRKSLRRSEIRRQISERTDPLLRRLRDRVGLVSPAIAAGFTALAILIILNGQEPFPYWEGQEVTKPIYARVPFEIIDHEGTEKTRQEFRDRSANYYNLNRHLLEQIASDLNSLYASVAGFENYEAYAAEMSTESATEVGEDKATDAKPKALDEPAFVKLVDMQNDEGRKDYQARVERLTDALKRERLILKNEADSRPSTTLSTYAILIGATPNTNDSEPEENGHIRVDTHKLDRFDSEWLERVDKVAEEIAFGHHIFPKELRPFVEHILKNRLKQESLFTFDFAYTQERMEEEAATASEVKFPYSRDAQLAWSDLPDDSPDKRKDGIYWLSHTQVRRLEVEHRQYTQLLSASQEELETNPPVSSQLDLREPWPLANALQQLEYSKNVGLSAAVVLIALGMIAYCAMFEPRVLRKPMRALSIAVLFLLMMAASRAAHLGGFAVHYPQVVVAPIIVTAAILTIVYSQRFAIGMTAALALLVTLAVRGDLGIVLLLTTVMAVVVYQMREIRSRNELFSTSLLNALAAFIAASVASLIAGQTPETAMRHGGIAAIAAVMAIAVFFLFLSPIERIFKVATNWTLLELLDTSRPSLTRLAQEAPGTYNHSLWLSAMAEDACEVIGANGLLAKVGSMYHDIGKIHKAEYFAENQQAQINRHDKLAPTMSLLVIVGHVKDGVEMAREYGLPPSLIRFIQEHHGTTVVRYFHHAASEQQKASGLGREISESEFRYPGPKPQSKETAVLMMCDSVEGAVRALPEPTAGRIENLVHSILMDRLNDGQFDDCDITLKELHRVEESLVKSLCRFYHGRVPYPKTERTEPAETKPQQPSIAS